MGSQLLLISCEKSLQKSHKMLQRIDE